MGSSEAKYNMHMRPTPEAGGLAPSRVTASPRPCRQERNRRFYQRYPQDVELVRSLVAGLHAAPAPLPRGGTLTARRFLQLGLLLGSASGFEALHDLLELARPPSADGLPDASPADRCSGV